MVAMPKLAMNTEEKSRSSEFFFCISAVFNPPCTKTSAIAINTITRAIKPKSLGAKTLARIIVRTNWINCAPHRSKNFQISEEIIVVLDGMTTG
jgi:hypothetical protein